MAFHKYYQDELSYLREMGQSFANYYPKLAPFLSYDSGDPDVERLLEGFAFLTAKLRQKIDDEVPEFTEGLFASIWPHFLRPVPSMSVLQFRTMPGAIGNRKTIPKGTEVESVPVEGTRCRFRTCYDVDVYPITIEHVEVRQLSKASNIYLTLRTENGIPLSDLDLDTLRIYLHGDNYLSQGLYLYLANHLNGIRMESETEDGFLDMAGVSLDAAGLGMRDELIPYPVNVASSYRYLQEYFSFPEKYQFFDLTGLRQYFSRRTGDKIRICFQLNRELPSDQQPGLDNFRLFCTPIVNIFSRDAEPIRLHNGRSEYSVKPSGNQAQHYEIFSIDKVSGIQQGDVSRKAYLNYHSIDNYMQDIAGDEGSNHYFLRYQPSILGNGIDTQISFRREGGDIVEQLKRTEVVSVSLSCTNGNLTRYLKLGDVSQHTSDTPEYVQFENITRVTQSYPPPIHLGMDWALIGSMSVNFESLTQVASFKQLISLYDFPSYYSKQIKRIHHLRLEGILSIESKNVTRIHQQLPVRGMKLVFVVDGSKFSADGEMYMFFTVVNRVLNSLCHINTFIEIEVRDTDSGELYSWPWKTGNRSVI